MLNSKDIRNVKFAKAMGGYKQEEVDVLLDKVEADYEQFERTLREMSSKIEQLRAEVEEYKNSQGSIQSVLLSAQKLADQIVEEAKTKSEEIIASAEKNIEKITAQEQELTTAFDKKAGERKSALENDIEKLLAEAERKQKSIEKATADSVERQQVLFDKLKIEIAAFKADITAKYKQHLELLSKIPDTVPSDPKEIAAAVSMALESAPDASQFVEDDVQPWLVEAQEPQDEPEEIISDTTQEEMGFIINADITDSDENEEDF